jgi:hypothetical protein
VRESERERERDRERESARETVIETHRKKERETDEQVSRHSPPAPLFHSRPYVAALDWGEGSGCRVFQGCGKRGG